MDNVQLADYLVRVNNIHVGKNELSPHFRGYNLNMHATFMFLLNAIAILRFTANYTHYGTLITCKLLESQNGGFVQKMIHYNFYWISSN